MYAFLKRGYVWGVLLSCVALFLASSDAVLAKPGASAVPVRDSVVAVDLMRNTVALVSTPAAATTLLGMCFQPSSDGKRLDPKVCLPKSSAPNIRAVVFSGEIATQMSYPGPHIAVNSAEIKWTRRTISKVYEYDSAPMLAAVYLACQNMHDPLLYVSSFSVGAGSRADVRTQLIGERALVGGAEFAAKTTAAKPIPPWSGGESVVEVTLASTSPLCADVASGYIGKLSLKSQQLQTAFDVYKDQMEQDVRALRTQLDAKTKDVSTKEKELQEKMAQLSEKDQTLRAREAELAKSAADLRAAVASLDKLRSTQIATAPSATPDAGP